MAKIIKVEEEQYRNGDKVRIACIVYYESGRVREYLHGEVPKTVWAFIEKATVTGSFRDWNKTVLTHIIVDDEPDTAETTPEHPENVKIYNSYEEYEKTHEDCQPKMNEVAVVYDSEYVCIDVIFDCKRVSTAVRRLFKNVDVKAIPELDGWYESISEATENGYMSGFDTSCGDYHGWYGYYAWRVECNEDYIYISLKVRRETETEETIEEQSDNISEPDAEPIPEREFNRVVCHCCKSCTRLSECDKVMTYDAFSNVTEEMECRCCDGEYTCCIDFTPERDPEELACINPDYFSCECELCSECVHYPECKEKGTVVMHHDGLCMYSVCPFSVCCQNFMPELPF